jgi:hypothetical protein
MRACLPALCLLLLAASPAPVAKPWVDLGFALPGKYGDPVLEVAGPLTGGSVLSIQLTNAEEFSHSYLVIGFSTLYAPYKGGTLVPAFDAIFPMATDEVGEISLIAHWPTGSPSGVPVIFQFWINDEHAVQDRSGSNAMGALTP